MSTPLNRVRVGRDGDAHCGRASVSAHGRVAESASPPSNGRASAMVPFDAFREDLAARLMHQAGRRRRLSPHQGATAQDRKVIALLEYLAEDVRHLDLHVFLIFQLMLSTTHLARRYGGRRNELFARIGVTYCPVDATDLVRWLTRTVVETDHDRFDAGVAAPQEGVTRPGLAAERKALAHTLSRPFRVTTEEGRVEWAIVVAFLVVWAVALGIGQWRDRAFVATHPAVPARVVAAEPSGGGKSSGVALNVLLDFEPAPTSPRCRSLTRVDFLPHRPEPGDAIAVVPRSSACEAPLFPQRIGNPLVSFSLAATFLAAGWKLGRGQSQFHSFEPLAS